MVCGGAKKPTDRKRGCHSACDVLPTHRAVQVCVTGEANGQGAICSSQALDEGGREVNRRVPYLPIQDGHGKQSEDCTAGRK